MPTRVQFLYHRLPRTSLGVTPEASVHHQGGPGKLYHHRAQQRKITGKVLGFEQCLGQIFLITNAPEFLVHEIQCSGVQAPLVPPLWIKEP